MEPFLRFGLRELGGTCIDFETCPYILSTDKKIDYCSLTIHED